ncbi:MAG: hypothetical protein QQN45_06670 [Nitrosopumilus sp.]
MNRKRKVFTDKVNGHLVYICQCNCGRWWLAERRYSFFKLEQKNHMIWLTVHTEEEKLQ